MSPRQLLEKLENLGIIDPSLLNKIRKEIDNPEKSVKPKAILKFLVSKNQITEKQAARLLKAAMTITRSSIRQELPMALSTLVDTPEAFQIPFRIQAVAFCVIRDSTENAAPFQWNNHLH